MPGLTLGIGETNPKIGAVQFDGRRVDGVLFVIPDAASVTQAVIGSVVTLQEDSRGRQRIVLGAAAYRDDEYYDYAIIGVGFLEAATQTDDQINQAVGYYVNGDFAAMVIDVNAVAMVPYATGEAPTAGGSAYVDEDGKLSSSASGNVAFPGEAWYGTAGIQNTGQLKTGYAFARLKSVTTG